MTLYLVITCYNEEAVLPETSRRLAEKLTALTAAGKISADSRVLFVDDGSKDPQPRPSERPPGRADDGKGALRRRHLPRRRPAG